MILQRVPNQPARARVQAVRTILEYAYKGIELEEIQTRLEEVLEG
ncbi:hypothetical protein [Streptococcus suis]